MSYGQDVSIGVCFQNSFGTSQVNSVYHISHISEAFAVAKEQIITQGMRGIYDEGEHYEGKNMNEGEFEAEIHPISLGVLLKAMFGDPVSVTSGAIYNHTFKPRTTDFDEFAASDPVTIAKDMGDAGSGHLYYDMVANTLGLSIANGELLKATQAFVGGSYEQASALAASYPLGNDHFVWDASSITFGGSAQPDMLNVSVSIEEGLEAKYGFDTTKTPYRVKRTGFRVINIEGTMLFINQNEYQEFLSQTKRSAVIHCKGPTEIQSGYYDELTIDIPNLLVTENKPVAGGPGQIEVPLVAKAVYHPGSATAIAFTLQNTQAAY